MSGSVNSMGQMKDPQNIPQLLRQLREDDPGIRSRISHELGLLAADFWSLDKVGEKAVPDLLMALYHEERTSQVRAIWALYWLAETMRLTDPELRDKSMKALIELLSHENDDLRLSVTYALMVFKDIRSVPALVEHGLSNKDRAIVIQTADVLGNLKDRRSVPGLLEALENSTDVVVRNIVIGALGALTDDRAVQPLMDILLSSDDSRGSAAVALGEIGDKQATPALLEALRNDSSQEVREQAAFGLAKMHDPRAVPDLIQVLHAVAPDAASTYKLRTMTVLALRMIGDESAMPALLEAIDNMPELQIRMAAINALASVTNPSKAASLLIRILHHDKNGTVRGFAARALGYLANECQDQELRDNIVSHLAQSLSDTEPGGVYVDRVCDEAARSLRFVGTPEALAAISDWQ